MAAAQRGRPPNIDAAPGPVGLGYLRLPEAAVPAGMVTAGIAVMEEFATAHGYCLGEVFVDDEPRRRLAWGQLLDAVRVRRPVVVLVPDLPLLRPSRPELLGMQARLRRVTTAPLVPARPRLCAPAEVSTAFRSAPIPVASPGSPVPRSRHARGVMVRARRRRAAWRLSWGR